MLAALAFLSLDSGRANAASPLTPALPYDPFCAVTNAGRIVLLRPQPASTRRMIERIARIRENAAPNSMAYLNDRILPILQKRLAASKDAREQIGLRLELGRQMIYAGLPEEGLKELDGVDQALAVLGGRLVPGRFVERTAEAGLLSLHPSQASTWFDYDGDGWLDVFIGNETWQNTDPDRCELFHNNGDGTFTECAVDSGINVMSLVKGVTSGDYNRDGRPDLYISCRDNPNLLFRNEGLGSPDAQGRKAWRFREVTAAAGINETVHSFPTWFFDYDNDGFEDLFVSGYWLRDVGEVAADYLGQRHQAAKPRLYRNLGNGTFTNLTAAVHLDRVCHTMGCNFGDLDHDGDQDVYLVVGGAFVGDHYPNALFLNPGHGNHWLKLQCVGTRCNRVAIGTRIKVTVRTPQGPRNIYKTVNSGGSFGSSPLRQEVGLGQATAILQVELEWPASGLRQVIRNLDLDRAYRIVEGAAEAVPLELPRLTFDTNAVPRHTHSEGRKSSL